MDTATSERLLRHLEQSQVLFEQDLADLDRNRPDGESTES